MLHFEVIDDVALGLLKAVAGTTVFADTRLVGGTALALQIGHRRSVDLDFFGRLNVSAMELERELRAHGGVSVRGLSARIRSYTVAGVQLDFVDYPYPWLDAPVMSDGVRLASCRDIAAMKLAAITNRGTKKDFVDLDFLLDMFSFPEMLSFYSRKFADGGVFAVLKSLIYFDDADDDPMPFMLKPREWQDVRERIARAVSAHAAGGDAGTGRRQG